MVIAGGSQSIVLRHGARGLLAQAVEAEVAALLGRHADDLTDDGRQRLVRPGICLSAR
jgi:putative transposase